MDRHPNISHFLLLFRMLLKLETSPDVVNCNCCLKNIRFNSLLLFAIKLDILRGTNVQMITA